jgi:hypothetical protein
VSGGQPGGAGFGTVFHPEPDPMPSGNGGPVRIGQLRPLPRKRRPGMVALAVVLIGVGILGGAALYQHVNRQVAVLMVRTAVPAGSVVTAADLVTTSVTTGSGVQVIPAGQERQVVGLVAGTSLRPDTLLASSELTTALPPAAGQALVPVALRPSQLPASGLVPGDQVVVAPAPDAQGSGSTVTLGGRTIPAVVAAVSRVTSANGEDVVDMLVPAGNGVALAKEAATGNIALVVTHRDSS